jgi:hypothetical protein
LVSPALRAADGRVRSWIGEGSYAYDEATALLARYRVWAGLGDAAPALVRRLDRGWLSRRGVEYAFDTGLGVRWGGPGLAAELIASLRDGDARKPASSANWSDRVGPHHLKILPELRRCGVSVDDVAESIVARAWTGQRFVIDAPSGATYLHAHCYALEGLVGLGGWGDVVLSGLDWLAQEQAQDGSLPAWVGRSDPRRPSDTVAQSVRLWSAVDSVRFAGSIARGLDWLASMQAPDGGIRYAPTHPERNTWATIFAAQAVEWARVPPEPSALLDLV